MDANPNLTLADQNSNNLVIMLFKKPTYYYASWVFCLICPFLRIELNSFNLIKKSLTY